MGNPLVLHAGTALTLRALLGLSVGVVDTSVWLDGQVSSRRGQALCADREPSPLTDDVLHTLTGAMSLLRRCRVNAALTIQLFSQLFHFINMWLFNRLVTDPESGLCSHYWGAILRQQLGHVEAWAEKQGLELAADCHLSRIVQVGGAGRVVPSVSNSPGVSRHLPGVFTRA